MTSTELLEAGLKRIENPKNWCKHRMQKTTWTGQTQYCLWGAVFNKSVGRVKTPEELEAVNWLHYAIPNHQSIITFNDKETTEHDHVINVLEWAIRYSRGDFDDATNQV